ncbi:MAG: hypothetical protein RL659_2259 [Pseudomonadota bacterium]
MSRILLAVDGLNAVLLADMNQSCKCHFGAVTERAEHGFAEHSFANTNKVQACHQVAIEPCFGAMRVACAVQGFVGIDHGRHDPCSFLALSGALRASFYHVVKCAVKTQLELRMRRITSQGFSQRSVKFEAFDLQHHARIGAPPQYRLVGVEPRKHAFGIGF